MEHPIFVYLFVICLISGHGELNFLTCTPVTAIYFASSIFYSFYFVFKT